MPIIKKLKTEHDPKEEEDIDDVEDDDEDLMSDDESEDPMDDNDEDDDESEDDDEAGIEDEEVMIDFEARELRETDLESVKLLINQKLGSFSLNLSEMSHIICQQDKLGNVVYQAANENEEADESTLDDNTIFGVLSLIDLNCEKFKSFSSSLKQFLVKECQKFDKSKKTNKTSKLNELFSQKTISYVVNEKFINIPPGISTPMFESLLKDLDIMKKQGNGSFSSDYWLFISRVFDEAAAKKTSSSKSGSKAEKLYTNPEEEFFEELNEFKFEINLANKMGSQWDEDQAEVNPGLNVFFVPFEKVSLAVEKFKSLIK